MADHEYAPVVRLLSDSSGEVERLIEEWVFAEGLFKPPIYISASILSETNIITALKVRWVWNYELASSMKRTISIGLAISLNIQLYKLSQSLGFKWHPSTPFEVYNTFTRLLSLIPSLQQYMSIEQS